MTEEIVNEIKWTIHETHPDKAPLAREKLSEVVDPEIGMNIIQLGLVRDITIENDIARLKMILTTPFCPYGPAMIEMTKAKAVEGLNMPVTIEMGMDMWDDLTIHGHASLDLYVFQKGSLFESHKYVRHWQSGKNKVTRQLKSIPTCSEIEPKLIELGEIQL